MRKSLAHLPKDKQTDEQKTLFDLLDYAYIGARYDRHYKITKQQLKQLAPCVKKLHEVTECVCKEKIESLTQPQRAQKTQRKYYEMV